jgi:hypothetical protein
MLVASGHVILHVTASWSVLCAEKGDAYSFKSVLYIMLLFPAKVHIRTLQYFQLVSKSLQHRRLNFEKK